MDNVLPTGTADPSPCYEAPHHARNRQWREGTHCLAPAVPQAALQSTSLWGLKRGLTFEGAPGVPLLLPRLSLLLRASIPCFRVTQARTSSNRSIWFSHTTHNPNPPWCGQCPGRKGSGQLVTSNSPHLDAGHSPAAPPGALHYAPKPPLPNGSPQLGRPYLCALNQHNRPQLPSLKVLRQAGEAAAGTISLWLKAMPWLVAPSSVSELLPCPPSGEGAPTGQGGIWGSSRAEGSLWGELGAAPGGTRLVPASSASPMGGTSGDTARGGKTLLQGESPRSGEWRRPRWSG